MHAGQPIIAQKCKSMHPLNALFVLSLHMEEALIRFYLEGKSLYCEWDDCHLYTQAYHTHNTLVQTSGTTTAQNPRCYTAENKRYPWPATSVLDFSGCQRMKLETLASLGAKFQVALGQEWRGRAEKATTSWLQGSWQWLTPHRLDHQFRNGLVHGRPPNFSSKVSAALSYGEGESLAHGWHFQL